MGRDAMTTFSLSEVEEQAPTSKGTIWQAIKAGCMSAIRSDEGGFAIDPAGLLRAFLPRTRREAPTSLAPIDIPALRRLISG